MDESKTQELLLQLLQDIAVVKAKLDAIEEIKLDAKTLNVRVDHLEAQNREQEKSIRSLEHRADEMERFTRNSMTDAKKQTNKMFISMAVAVFSAILSVLVGFIV